MAPYLFQFPDGEFITVMACDSFHAMDLLREELDNLNRPDLFDEFLDQVILTQSSWEFKEISLQFHRVASNSRRVKQQSP